MYSKLINYFTENTEYEFKLTVNKETNSTAEEFLDLEKRIFPVSDCWEFIGFADGVYFASSQKEHIKKIEKMESEYDQLVNDLLDEQVLRRLNKFFGNDAVQLYSLFEGLEQFSIDVQNFGEDYNVIIAATWEIRIPENSLIETKDDPSELFYKTKIFDKKYKQGFQLALSDEISIDDKILKRFYHDYEFELPFSAEYVFLAAEEN